MFLLPAIIGATCLAADAPAVNKAWPPSQYRLEDTRILVDVLPAHGLPRQTLTLAGDGQALFAHGSTMLRYPMAADELLVAVNALYGMRFFDMPVRILPQSSVYLRNDGSVGTQARRLHDTPTTRVCFSLPQFEKCVAFEADPPAELAQLTKRLLAVARQQTGPARK